LGTKTTRGGGDVVGYIPDEDIDRIQYQLDSCFPCELEKNPLLQHGQSLLAVYENALKMQERIDELEAALRNIVDLGHDWDTCSRPEHSQLCHGCIANKALKGQAK
jgi:hypothetical protein